MIKKLAIIGFGSIGKRHLKIVKKISPESYVILVRSGKGIATDEENLADEVTYFFDDILTCNIDAAIIASPSTFHKDQMLKLMKRGIHVLVEKPVSDSSKGLNQLVQIKNDKNLVCLVGYCLRYDQSAIKFKNLLDKNLIGDLMHVRINCSSYLPDWRPNQDYKKTVSSIKKLGGGVLLELSHELDYLRWFFGDMHSVYANIGNSLKLEIDVEDMVDMLIISKNNLQINLHIDFNSKVNFRSCTVSGSKGNLTWNALSKVVTLNHDNYKSKEYLFEQRRDEMYESQFKHFIQLIKKRTNPVITLDEAIKVLNLIEAAKKSYLTSRKVIVC